MALPIEPTPPVTGQDAVRLLESLKNLASDEEIQRRQKAAKRSLALMRERSAKHFHEILKK